MEKENKFYGNLLWIFHKKCYNKKALCYAQKRKEHVKAGR